MARRFRFGAFELDVPAYTLRRGTAAIRLERLPMDVLVLLVEAAGTLVDRDHIREKLWGSETFLEYDAAINTAIRKIRHALGDDADDPRFIETVVGKGYRFIAPVEHEGGGTSPDHERPAGPSRRGLPIYSVSRGRDEFVLQPGDNLLGRMPTAAVVVDHPSVSRRHASISVRVGCVVIEDLESRNGTFVNGRPVKTPTEISNGAVIGLGPITLKFIVRAAPASTRSMSGHDSIA